MSLLNVKQKEMTGRTNYIGLIPYNVICVNPSREELMKILNTENISETSYVTDGKARLDFWLRNDELNVINKLSIWLEAKERISGNGNTLFINEKNQTTWGESLDAIAAKPNMNWFDVSTARPCGVGEDILYNFVVTLINAETKDGGIRLDNYNAIFEGNIEELTKLINHYSDRQIKLLTGVKDGRSRIYSRYFVKAETNSIKGLMNALEGSPFDAHYTLDGIQKYDMPTTPVNQIPKEETTTGTVRALF